MVNFMGAKKEITAYFKNYRYAEDFGKEEDGCALLAAKQAYEVTGEETCFFFMKKYYDAFLTEHGELQNNAADFTAEWVNGSRCLFFLYQETGEEKYRLAAENIMEELRGYPRCECGNFVHRKECLKKVSVDALYMLMPFYMEYETVYGKKEKYGDIITQFENARERLYDEDRGLCSPVWDEDEKGRRGEDGNKFLSTAKFLTALIDTMECMSIEIYEQYRKLQDMFKTILRGALDCSEEISGESGALIGYCILKACRMGILLKEKYVDTGMEIVEKLAAEQPEMTNAFIMAYAQYLLTKREAEA